MSKIKQNGNLLEQFIVRSCTDESFGVGLIFDSIEDAHDFIECSDIPDVEKNNTYVQQIFIYKSM